jgi:hypothetical protein
VTPAQPGFLVFENQESELEVDSVNYFDEGESDLRNKEIVRLSELRQRPTVSDNESLSPLQDWLAWLVILLLLIDLILFSSGLMKRSSATGSTKGVA